MAGNKPVRGFSEELIKAPIFGRPCELKQLAVGHDRLAGMIAQRIGEAL
jgi:hypothetical protein